MKLILQKQEPARLGKKTPSTKMEIVENRLRVFAITLILFVQFKLGVGVYKKQEPARLEKNNQKRSKLSLFVEEYYFYLLIAASIAGIIVFVVGCFMFVPPVESGVYYNHLR